MNIDGFFNRLFGRNSLHDQRENEEVVLLVRRHHFFLLRSLAVPLVLLLILLLIKTINVLGWRVFTALDWVAGLPTLVYGIAFIILLIWLAFAYKEWENDFLLLTNRRIVCQRQIYRFTEETVEAELTRIQDISIRVNGPFASLLGYGDLVISTAGVRGQLAFHGMADPDQIKALIFSLVEEIDGEESDVRKTTIKERLAGELGFGKQKVDG